MNQSLTFRPRADFGRHHRELHRTPERRPGRAGHVRRAHPDSDVHDRRRTGGDRRHGDTPHTDLLQRQAWYDWPISSGRPGDDTPDGSYLTIEKENPVEMKGPGYDLMVPWSVRFTFSGDYYHDAYWSVGEQGFENVSHGCINLAPADAETYYNLAVPGDPITIAGSPRGGTWDDGWTEWFLAGLSTSRAVRCTRRLRRGRAAARSLTPQRARRDRDRAPADRTARQLSRKIKLSRRISRRIRGRAIGNGTCVTINFYICRVRWVSSPQSGH